MHPTASDTCCKVLRPTFLFFKLRRCGCGEGGGGGGGGWVVVVMVEIWLW